MLNIVKLSISIFSLKFRNKTYLTIKHVSICNLSGLKINEVSKPTVRIYLKPMTLESNIIIYWYKSVFPSQIFDIHFSRS